MSNDKNKSEHPIADVANSAAVNARDAVRDTARDAKHLIEEGAAKIKEAAGGLSDKAHDVARDAGDTLEDAGVKIRDTVRDAGRDLKKKLD
jgi:hypothetical protein